MRQVALLGVVLVAVVLAAPAFAAGPRPEMITDKTEEAIVKGLQYLGSAQLKDGSWDAGSQAGMGGGYGATMTGLAGIAILSSGSTPTRGPYSENLRRGIYWLLSQQNPTTGLICSRAEEARSMYGHGFSTLFLAESLGMAGNKKLEARIRVTLQRAIKLTEGSQSPLGGWIYTPSGGADEGSVTVTQVQALRACENAGVQVSRAMVDKAFDYLKKAKCADGGIAYSARMPGGGSRPAITAAALTCLYSAGKYDDPLTKSVLDYCLKNYNSMLGSGGGFGHFYYTHLYLAEALYQHGGVPWKEYFPKIRDWLLKNQQQNGSWQGDGVGTVYGTSIALVILQLPYGYLPVVQK